MFRKYLMLALAALCAQALLAQRIEGDVFIEGQGLKGEYVMPDNITEIADHAFFQGDIEKITLSKNLKKVGTLAFGYCEKLTEVVFPKGCTPDTIGEDCFANCIKITKITLPNSLCCLGARTFWGCEKLSDITLPSALDTLPQHIFQSCIELREIRLPEKLKVIQHNAFAGCVALDDVTIPSVDSIATKAFYACKALRTLELPNNLRTIADSAFMRCERMKMFTLPKSVESVGVRLFRGSKKMAKILVEDGSNHFVSVNGVLYSKDLKTLYECPADFTSEKFVVPESVERLYPYSFFECDNIASIKIPQTIKRIGLSALCYNGMSSFELEGNDSFRVHKGALYYYKKGDDGNMAPVALIAYPAKRKGTCSIIKGTQLVAQYAFAGAEQLEEIRLPGSVVGIDTCAMLNAIGLKRLYSASENPPKTFHAAFSGVRQPDVTCYIPKGTLQNYATKAIWIYFALTETDELAAKLVEAEESSRIHYLAGRKTLMIDALRPVKLTLFDTTGRVVLSRELPVGLSEEALEEVSTGLYIAQTSDGDHCKFLH